MLRSRVICLVLLPRGKGLVDCLYLRVVPLPESGND